jgi:hypothetical protein
MSCIRKLSWYLDYDAKNVTSKCRLLSVLVDRLLGGL